MTLFCHSFWRLIWKYIWHIFSDVLFWNSIWHSILAFYQPSILTSYLASLMAFILTFSLAFYLASVLIFYLASILTFFLASILASCPAGWYLACGGKMCQSLVAVKTFIFLLPQVFFYCRRWLLFLRGRCSIWRPNRLWREDCFSVFNRLWR